MSKKLLAFALVVGWLAAACAKAPVPVAVGAGSPSVTAVADPLNNAGVDPSVVVVNGQPYMAYFAFEEQVPEGSFPQTRPVGSPSLPGVMLTTVNGGIWTRGAIAIAAEIPNIAVKFNPAFEKSVSKLTAQNVTGLQLVADANGGLHAIWGSSEGLYYASGTADPSSTTQWTVEKVSVSPPYGPSLALDASGNPWIAYTTARSAGNLTVATMGASGWSSEVVASGAGCSGCRTAIAVNGGGDPVVVYSDGTDVLAATRAKKGWTSVPVERGGLGAGLAATTTSNGDVVLSYETSAQVHVASSSGGAGWTTTSVADVEQGESSVGMSTGVAVDGQGGTEVAWYDTGAGNVGAATSGDGKSFTAVDLGTTGGGQSPSVATTPDGTTTVVGWYDSIGQNAMLTSFGQLPAIALAKPSPTPTQFVPPSAAPSPSQCAQVVGGKVTVVAQGVAYTDGRCIDAPAGEDFTIVFENKDSGVQHNIEIFGGAQISGSPIFSGDIITGPAQAEYKVKALDAGTYAFNCVVHPTTMIGQINVTAGGGGGTAGGGGGAAGGGGGAVTTTVVAQNVAFDTSTITLAANESSTITFDNKDAGVQHNIAIYPSAQDLSKPLFRGDLVTGPGSATYQIPALKPGTYYFQCDIHPTTMNGQVVVQ